MFVSLRLAKRNVCFFMLENFFLLHALVELRFKIGVVGDLGYAQKLPNELKFTTEFFFMGQAI